MVFCCSDFARGHFHIFFFVLLYEGTLTLFIVKIFIIIVSNMENHYVIKVDGKQYGNT